MVADVEPAMGRIKAERLHQLLAQAALGSDGEWPGRQARLAPPRIAGLRHHVAGCTAVKKKR
jgi:hypothetical protein